MTDRRTRIVATLGPATDRRGVLEALLDLGLDVARINFSHGEGSGHRERVARLQAHADRRSRPVAVLADLPGPKLRVRLSELRPLTIGQTLTFVAGTPGPGELTVTEPECLSDVRPGHRVLLDDGRLQLRVARADGG